MGQHRAVFGFGRKTVIERTWDFTRNVLVERAPERHIEHLMATTNAQHGFAVLEGFARQIHLAVVLQGAGFAQLWVVCMPVLIRVDVDTPGQQQPVD